jgi:hypothetical protein
MHAGIDIDAMMGKDAVARAPRQAVLRSFFGSHGNASIEQAAGLLGSEHAAFRQMPFEGVLAERAHAVP